MCLSLCTPEPQPRASTCQGFSPCLCWDVGLPASTLLKLSMHFSVQEGHLSRVEQKLKEKAHKEVMNEQMRAVTEARAKQESASKAREDAIRERQRSAIATPGMRHTSQITPRRRFGL